MTAEINESRIAIMDLRRKRSILHQTVVQGGKGQAPRQSQKGQRRTASPISLPPLCQPPP
jgi:hypothetical protein